MAKKSKKAKIEETQNLEETAAPEATSEELSDELGGDIEISASLFQSEETELEGFLPEASDEEEVEVMLASSSEVDLEGSELDGFESAQIDELEFVEDEHAESIVESILFASDRPVSLASIKEVFKGTNVRKDKIKRILDNLAVEYASGRRGVTLEEITGGYQLRTKIDNMNFIKRTVKARAFKLSGPALETLAIVAYKQPVVKSEIDQIRGVESGHLLRALMEKGLCNFEGKAENLPGRPMQ
jgi:segregation and condensation protein B